MTPALIAGLLGALGTAGGVIWALVESRKRVKAEGARDRWKNAFDLAASQAAANADELRAERERAADAELRARAAARVSLADLEACRAEIPKIIAAAGPDAPRLAGDFLERSLQRAVEATRRAATAPGRPAALPGRGPAAVPGVGRPREGG